MKGRLRIFLLAVAALTFAQACRAAEPIEVTIGYLHARRAKARISLIDVPANDDGLAGAKLAITDNNTTGAFVNLHFTLVEKELRQGDNPAVAVGALAQQGASFVIADLDAQMLLAAADAAQGQNTVLLNVSAPDERLREEDCRANVIHVAPSRSMLADGLAQYLVWKRWSKWLLVSGSHDADKAVRRRVAKGGEALRREDRRRTRIQGHRRRAHDGQRDRARFSGRCRCSRRSAPDYDVLVAADESEVFAGYLPYRTWDARPVAGSAGLVPTSWDPAFDQWGAIQLQSRFGRAFHRTMSALDMQRLDRGAHRRRGGDAGWNRRAGHAFRLHQGPGVFVAAFKGQKLTLRDWNLQLRQPILLFDGRNTVSVSPQEGFLHPTSELDTLGPDRPETKCKLQ